MHLLSLSLVLLAWQAQQDALPPDLELLSRIKVRMAENLSRLPNYTCLQTIERTQRQPGSAKFGPIDTVRLEVAFVEGKEVFGWPGGNKIAESEITNLVSGTIGNGDFALFLKSIFLGSAPSFRYTGESSLDGRRALKFEYVVSLLSSGYHLKVPPRDAVVPYHGTFWVEPETLDLIRLELIADAIPVYLGISAASDAMDYGRVEIGGAKFLLPRSSELRLTDLRGVENRNRTRFTACRQFTGESVLSFGDLPAGTPEARPSPSQKIELPKSFEADFALETPIDSGTSAVGDTIRAKLEREVKAGNRTLVPKGAELTGRISRLNRSGQGYLLDVAMTAIDFTGGHADLAGRENTASIQISSLMFRPDTLPHGDRTGFTTLATPATIPASHFTLAVGSRLSIRSRLVQSEQ